MARLAYLFSTFPALSTTFTQHQVRAAENMGLDAVFISNRPPAPDGFHPGDRDFYERTIYLVRRPVWAYAAAVVKAMWHAPAGCLGGLGWALSLRDGFKWQRLTNLVHLAGAALVWDILRQKGVRRVHVHFAFGAAGIAMFLRKISGIPYSISVHGSDVLLPRPLVGAKLQHADFVVTNCEFHIDNLKNRYPFLLTVPFHVVLGGVDTKNGPWSRYTPPERDRTLRILVAARLEPVKAHDFLLKALAGLRDQGISFECRLAGDGPLKEKLSDMIQELGLSSSVHLLGSVYQDEMARLYEWCQVTVLSSLSEGTPMCYIEAMAKARAVVGPNITAIPEMIEHGLNGFLYEKENVDDLCGCLRQLAEGPDLVERMGLAGRKKAERLFDLETNVRYLAALFEKAADASGTAEDSE